MGQRVPEWTDGQGHRRIRSLPPEHQINAEPGEWSSYWDKLATKTAANDAPDVIQMDQKYIAEYGGRGALMDLAKQNGIDTARLDKEALASGQYDGAVRAEHRPERLCHHGQHQGV